MLSPLPFQPTTTTCSVLMLSIFFAGCSDTPKFPEFVPETGRQCGVGAVTPTPPPAVDASPPGDSAVPDSAVPDSAVPDSAVPDSAVPDSGSGDSGASPDASTGGIGCTAAELCVAGRCVPRCTSDSTCSSGEMCDTTSGLCVSRTEPRVDSSVPDADPPDADPPMPCDGVVCDDAALSVCHPASGECVQCQDGAMCGGGVPVCDIARGGCTSFAAIDCAPCNNDFDCAGLPGTCVALSEPAERVCLPSCALGEPCRQGLSCDSVLGVCVPGAGSCTSFFSATRATPCADDAACVPRGETPTVGMCEGADPATMTMGVCRQPCALDDECPAGLSCLGGDFCRP